MLQFITRHQKSTWPADEKWLLDCIFLPKSAGVCARERFVHCFFISNECEQSQQQAGQHHNQRISNGSPHNAHIHNNTCKSKCPSFSCDACNGRAETVQFRFHSSPWPASHYSSPPHASFCCIIPSPSVDGAALYNATTSLLYPRFGAPGTTTTTTRSSSVKRK